MRVTANQQINNIHARVLERGANKSVPQKAFVVVGQQCRYRGKPFSRAYAALIQINNESTQVYSTSNKKLFAL